MIVKKIFNYFKKDQTANIAMERLHIIVSHKKSSANNSTRNDYLPSLKQDLIEVIRRYVNVDENSVNVNLEQSPTNDKLEINIGLENLDNING